MCPRRILLCCCLLITTVACGSSSASAPLATPTVLLLVTVPSDATTTPTPFQPLLITDTPVPASPSSLSLSPSPLPSTPDPAALLPGMWIPPAFTSPDYAPPPFPILTDRETVTFLLLGSDKRSGSSYRTDTLVVVALRPNSGQVTLISIPRDLWVYAPGWGMAKINTVYLHGETYGYPGGGPGLLKDTILYNLGIRIDHTAIVDFDGFRRIVDTLGGIDVPVACSYTDWRLIDPSLNPYNENNWTLYTIGPGVVHMDGELALWYARSRLKSSDYDRGRRQQEVLRAIYTRALQTDAIAKLPQLYTDLNASVVTDLGLADLLNLANLAQFTLHLTNADIRSYYIRPPLVIGTLNASGIYIQLPDAPALQAMLGEALSPSARRPEQQALLIEVRNGTLNDGWDTLAAERLNYAGYETRLAPADRRDYAGSLLYDLTAAQDPGRASSLLAILGLPPTALVSVPMTDSPASFVLIVGADYQPCFNPVNLAP